MSGFFIHNKTRVYGACVAAFFVIGTAHAMEVEVRGLAVVMSGPVIGTELRMLKSALKSNPAITMVLLKNSHGGDSQESYAVAEFIRERGLKTALSGYCISSCARMFMGGKERYYSDDQSLERTFAGFHGDYFRYTGNTSIVDRGALEGTLLKSRMEYLKEWMIKHSDGKANPELVDQWVHISNRFGYVAFYHHDAKVLPGSQKVMACQGTEERGKRQEQCAKPEMGDALINGIVTSWDVLPVRSQSENAASVGVISKELESSVDDSGYASINNVDAIPYSKEKGRSAYASYITKEFPRAFAIAPNGAFGWYSGSEDARDRAIDNCNKYGGGKCKLYSVDEKVVWINKSE